MALRKLELSKLDIGALAILEALLIECSVSRAADRLGLSQPTVSTALARLRGGLNDPILVKVGRHMVPTDRALELKPIIEGLVRELTAIGSNAEFDPATTRQPFTVAITDHAGVVMLPRLTRLIREAAPNARLRVVSIGNPYADPDHDDRRADIYIHWVRSPPQDWHVTRLFDEELVLIGRADTPSIREGLTLQEFLQLDHATLEPEDGTLGRGVDFTLERMEMKRNVVMTLSHFTTLPFVIAESDLVALFPRSLAELYAGITPLAIVRPPEPFRSFPISMSWHPRNHHDPRHVWLRRIALAAARQATAKQARD